MGTTGVLVPVLDVTSAQLRNMDEVLCRVEYMEARVEGFYTGETGRPRSSVAGVGSVGLCGERRLGNHGLSNAFVCPGHSMLTSR